MAVSIPISISKRQHIFQYVRPFLWSVLIVGVTLFLGACSGSPSSQIQGPFVIRDRSPVGFRGVNPNAFPVRGIDAARFQKFVHWDAARQSGVRFAFIKATEGGDLKDPMFRNHWRAAKRAGIKRGAYHFYYFCTPALVQANWFIRNVPRRQGDLPPVLDLEWNPFSPTCTYRPPAEVVRRDIGVFLRTVENAFGQRPIIYTTPGFYRDNALHLIQHEEFWLRSTAVSPAETFPGQRWIFWQYSATGILPGTPGDVDLNVFAGTEGAWNAWLDRRMLR